MKAFIEANFKMMDADGDDLVSRNEFRYNCISRVAVDDIKIIDDAFEKLLNVSSARHTVKCVHNFFVFFCRTMIGSEVASIWQDTKNIMANLLVAQTTKITQFTYLAHYKSKK